MRCSDEGKERLLSGNKGEGAAFMKEISEFYGHFSQRGLDESNEIIEAIYSNKYKVCFNNY